MVKLFLRIFRRRPRLSPIEIGKPVMLSRETGLRLIRLAIGEATRKAA
jgi:hypothetical protein